MAEAIKVAVRVRPLNQREKNMDCIVAVSMQDKTTMVNTGRSQKNFTYDFCYWSLDFEDKLCHTQEHVFQDIGKAILSNALNGFNGTLFTYGQTGSGKSYSVMGPADDPGLIPLTVADLFCWKAEQQGDLKEVRIWASYLEIYKEQVTDLFSTGTVKDPRTEKKELKIMDHPNFGVYVRGLVEVACETKNDVMANLEFGVKNRVVAATNMNAKSSRSHAVFTIKVNTLEGAKPRHGQKDERKVLSAKVNLIDLAGSERSGKAGTEGERLKEGSAINQSLSALGMCIKALSESAKAAEGEGKGTSVVPFRMSKLTFLLKDSLAGNSKTFMMATISPASENIEESLSTLRFASSVKTIQTVAIQNKDKKDEMIEKMEEEIRNLKAQITLGGPDLAEASELVKERQRLKSEMQKDFQEDLRLAREMHVAREQALEDNGLSQTHITQAFGISKGTPYLLNMADDPMLAGCLIYLIKESELTRIGAHQDNTITLNGVGIPDFLCNIKNDDNMKVTVERISELGRVVVNGKLLQPGQPRSLHNGDHIYLGRAHALKLVMPEDPNPHSAVTSAHDLSLEGLEDEYAALDDSPSWRSFTMYLDQVFRQLPLTQHSKLLGELKKACMCCDEANELTHECRMDEPLQFEVDLTTTVPPCVVVRVMYCAEGVGCQDETAWDTKYLWSVAQLSDRMERMRDFCENVKRNSLFEFDTIEDPWHEVDQVTVAERIRRAENYAVELQAVVQAHMFQENTVAKKMRTLFLVGLMGPSGDAKSSTLDYFLKIWRNVVLKSKADAQLLKRDAKKVISRRRTASSGSSGSYPSFSHTRTSKDTTNSQPPPRLPAGNRRLTLHGQKSSLKSPVNNRKSSVENTSPSSARSPGRIRINSDASEVTFQASVDTNKGQEQDVGHVASLDFGHISSEASEAPDLSHIQCHTGRGSCCIAVAEETKALATAEFLARENERQTKFDMQVVAARFEVATLKTQLQQSKKECEELQASCTTNDRQLVQASEEISSLKARLRRSEQEREQMQEKGVRRIDRRIEEAESELDSLKSQLQHCKRECEDSKKQQEVAWQLCAVLRAYASQLQDAPAKANETTATSKASYARKEGATLPAGLPLDALEAAKWWMYNNPDSASSWSAVTEKMEAKMASKPPIPSLLAGLITAKTIPPTDQTLAPANETPRRP